MSSYTWNHDSNNSLEHVAILALPSRSVEDAIAARLLARVAGVRAHRSQQVPHSTNLGILDIPDRHSCTSYLVSCDEFFRGASC